MRKISLKVKLTILYTLLMTAVICVVFGILFSINNQEILSTVQNQLEETVAGARNKIEYRNGALEFDSDLLELKHGIFLSVYSSDGSLLYGKIPYEFEEEVPFEDGVIRKYGKSEDLQFYVLDLVHYVPDYGVVDIRGITSITEAEAGFRETQRLIIILLPLALVLTACAGYYMTGRTLRPVKQIMNTVHAILEDGDFSRKVGLSGDGDEFYRLAATFDQMLDKVDESISREQQFSSDVAHELRTPVSTMLLQCEELMNRKEVSNDKELAEGIRLIQQKTQYLSQMISQLLILSRVDQGRMHLEMEKVNFSDLTELASDVIRAEAELKNIEVITEINPEIYIHGDETLLIRFWMNLLKNAVTYGKEGGWIRIGLRIRENEIQGEIQDNGIGIQEEDLPHIWERFYRADRSRTGSENSGLGLSMVKWIVEAHDGTIKVCSQPDKGTEFSFSFPVSGGESCK